MRFTVERKCALFEIHGCFRDRELRGKVDIETTVTLFDGSEITNPLGVEYTLAGPAFEAPDCPAAMPNSDECYTTGGPTLTGLRT